MKKFFGIKENHYVFEWADFTTVLTIFNVLFIIMGFAWAPWFGVVNCVLGLILNVKYRSHINMYVMQMTLLILNLFFLGLL